MSGRAGGVTADEPELVAITDVLDEVRSRLPSDLAGRVVVQIEANVRSVCVPRAGLSQTLLSLLNNALDASATTNATIIVGVTTTPDVFRVTVADQGSGLSPEACAGPVNRSTPRKSLAAASGSDCSWHAYLRNGSADR